mmetsp:Transcript_15189/g.59441  ORF Transcript_15189/g.59441 Transcript_15189/m.59441 type:complete len:514 (-) Transcript_15189:40-1581(-)
MQRALVAGRLAQGTLRVAGASRAYSTTTNRQVVQWRNKDFLDKQKLEEETRRVFDVCHGCRACFNLCDSFPKLFKLVDELSPTQELDGVPSTAFKDVFDACTLCDMCYEASCPYVPPHELDIDFPHLVLRYRAVEAAEAKATEEGPFRLPHSDYKAEVLPGVARSLATAKPSWIHRLMANTDLVARAMTLMPSLMNGFLLPSSTLGQVLVRKVAGIHPEAHLPSYVDRSHTLVAQASARGAAVNEKAPAFGKRKVVLYATCLGNHNEPNIGMAAKAVLEHLGVPVEVVYPGCCGMPKLEAGELGSVEAKAKAVVGQLRPHVEGGADVVCIVASCSLMLKKEWPLLFPGLEGLDAMKGKTFDVSEYVVMLAKEHGIPEGLRHDGAHITLHNACHARAQSIGFKSMEMLRLIKGAKLTPVVRCSGHGGSWGVREENFETALKVGKPAMKQVLTSGKKASAAGAPHYLASDCPLALSHLEQGAKKLAEGEGENVDMRRLHPVEIFANAYGLLPAPK